MLDEKKIEMEMEKIDLVAKVEAFNKKAAMLGIDPIVIGANVTVSKTESEETGNESRADRLNKLFKNRIFDTSSEALDALYHITKDRRYTYQGTLDDGTYYSIDRKDYCEYTLHFT